MIDVLVFFLVIIGVFGPLLFVRPWVKALGGWVADQPRLAQAVDKVRSLHLGKLPVGKLIINYWVAWVLGLLLVLAIMLLLTRLMPLLVVLFFGPGVAVVLVANVLDLDDELPGFLHLPHLDSWRVLGFSGPDPHRLSARPGRRGADYGARPACRRAARDPRSEGTGVPGKPGDGV